MKCEDRNMKCEDLGEDRLQEPGYVATPHMQRL